MSLSLHEKYMEFTRGDLIYAADLVTEAGPGPGIVLEELA